MSLPVRHLPVLQNWDCRGCSNCCREYLVFVTEEERQRILNQAWDKTPELGELPLFIKKGPPWARRHYLNHRPDGSCVFLSDQGRCRIHEKFGGEAKPLACRLYPFVLVPAGDHWRVGLRFACPSAAENQGKPLSQHDSDLEQYASEVERQAGVKLPLPPPPLQAGQRLPWPDLLPFTQMLLSLVRNRRDRMERRMRKCLALAALCRKARFDKLQGSRLGEFLNVVCAGLEGDVPAEPASLPPPTWIGRVLFRQALALYARKDHGPHQSRVHGRLALLRAAWRFATGRGQVPRVHGWLPETTFDRAETPMGALPEDAEQVLERYYAVKISSLQFCGPTNFGLSFWDGLDSLALTLPMILWITRTLADLPPQQAVIRAVGMVDNNFGFNRLLGTRRQRLGLKILAHRGELEKLIAWYGR